ncbi:tRNA-dihydrouridine synthase [Mangrovibacterium marinum]|uniref:tRNA-dihydrouridine synthase n=1 Tax=Mangrovibacterium marinum TaxID=1639118 RepID=A0A2T5C2L1_9BACT|nr:tRNA-dihydrouridine synthase family protein [Mangrovibacterium marinum]PTN08980.1 tRNA-U20a,U20b-dihydrouridine synthase [Mangrovibacterium marinum]
MDKPPIFHLAPLQGFTDFVYRKCYHQLFGNINAYYIPYISLGPGAKIRNSQLRDLLPENNQEVPVVPQVLCSNLSELRELAPIIRDFGYSKLNLNMGCPYPMATNRGRGSALLEKPDELQQMFDLLFSKFNFEVSVKFRAGITDEEPIFKLIPLLRAYPFSQHIFHPRTAKQLYKGQANRDLYARFVEAFGQPVVYNGDISTASDIAQLQQLVPTQHEWMIGRGILSDPFLIARINKQLPDPTTQTEMKRTFHELVFEEYQRHFSDNGQVLMKMKSFWSYFANSFSNPHKAFKIVKKASSLTKFKASYPETFRLY